MLYILKEPFVNSGYGKRVTQMDMFQATYYRWLAVQNARDEERREQRRIERWHAKLRRDKEKAAQEARVLRKAKNCYLISNITLELRRVNKRLAQAQMEFAKFKNVDLTDPKKKFQYDLAECSVLSQSLRQQIFEFILEFEEETRSKGYLLDTIEAHLKVVTKNLREGRRLYSEEVLGRLKFQKYAFEEVQHFAYVNRDKK